MVFVDTIQTIIIPFMIISILNLSIGYRLLNKLRQRSRTNMPRNNSILLVDLIQDGTSFNGNEIRNRIPFSRRLRSSSKKEPLILFIIVTMFLILNFPITINKVMNFFTINQHHNIDVNDFYHELNSLRKITNYNDFGVDNFTYFFDQTNLKFEIKLENINQTMIFNSPEQIKSIQFEEIQTKISSFIYYINFSINFFLYTFNTKQFKENFLQIFKK